MASASSYGQEEEKSLTCSVCLELFCDPVTLPCGHTYCRACVVRSWTTPDQEEAAAADGSRGVCPDCRRIFSPRPELSRNVVVADLAARLSEMRAAGQAGTSGGRGGGGGGGGGGDPSEVPCDICRGPGRLVAVRSCLRCEVSLCECHLEPHSRLPHLRLSHPLVAPRPRGAAAEEEDDEEDEEEDEDGAARRRRRRRMRWTRCDEHGLELELYCREEGELACRACTADSGRHGRGHRAGPVAEERARQSERLASCKRCLRDRQRSINVYLQELHRTTLALDESCVATESRLAAKFDSLLGLLTAERLSALATPRAELRAKEAELRAEAARLRAELGLLQEALGSVHELEATENHVAFIRVTALE